MAHRLWKWTTLFYIRTTIKENAPTGGKTNAMKLPDWNENPNQKIMNTKSLFSRGILNRKQNLAILNLGNEQGCEYGWSTRQDKQNTLAGRTGEDKDFIHMREGKQSRIRDNARLVTQEDWQVTWNERRVTFQNKTCIFKTKKPKTGHPSLRYDNQHEMEVENFPFVGRIKSYFIYLINGRVLINTKK